MVAARQLNMGMLEKMAETFRSFLGEMAFNFHNKKLESVLVKPKMCAKTCKRGNYGIERNNSATSGGKSG